MKTHKEAAFRQYRDSFPSDAFLRKYFGSREDLIREEAMTLNALLRQRGLDAFNDVYLAELLKQGIFRKSWSPFRRWSSNPFVIDMGALEKEVDPYVGLRLWFDTVLRRKAEFTISQFPWAPAHFHAHHRRVYLFREIRDRYCGGLCDDIKFEEPRVFGARITQEAIKELCTEFIEHYHNGAFSTEPWWEWRRERGSIWVQVIPGAFEEYVEILRKEREEAAKHERARVIHF